RRRMQTDLAALEVDLLAFADERALLHVDDAVLAEAGHRHAGLRVERHEAIAGRDVDDALVAFAVGPVREAAAGELSRRVHRARTLALRVHPNQLTGLAVQRDNGSPRAA